MGLSLKYFSNSISKIRGIRIKESFLKTIELNCEELRINYISIIIEDKLSLEDLTSLKNKPVNFFIELVCPVSLCISNSILLENFTFADKIILDIDSASQLEFLPKLYADCISIRKFPFVSGAPLCTIPLTQSHDILNGKKGIEHSSISCKDCAIKHLCAVQEEDYNISPLTKKSVNDILSYVNSNESNVNQF